MQGEDTMIIALFPNKAKLESKNILLGVIDYLENHQITVVTEEEDAQEFGCESIDDYDPTEINFLISMGGDGTLLQTAHKYRDYDAPILGINLGHLGFMADVPVPDLYPSLQDLINGSYKIDERLLLRALSNKGDESVAINDFVLHRAKTPSLISIGIHVNGVYLNTFEADGVVIATPTGSTAYSLAAGGPIVSPELDGILITPICAHTISNRPILLPPDAEIQVQYLSDYDTVEFIADGLDCYEMRTGEAFRISKSPHRFKLVNLYRHDYFSTLRTKLGWSGKLR